jgi:hypothetical protein
MLAESSIVSAYIMENIEISMLSSIYNIPYGCVLLSTFSNRSGDGFLVLLEALVEVSAMEVWMSLKKAMSSSLLCFLTETGNTASLSSELTTLTEQVQGGGRKPCRGALEKIKPSAKSTRFSGCTRCSIAVLVSLIVALGCDADNSSFVSGVGASMLCSAAIGRI